LRLTHFAGESSIGPGCDDERSKAFFSEEKKQKTLVIQGMPPGDPRIKS
jgi:hypothetical protein